MQRFSHILGSPAVYAKHMVSAVPADSQPASLWMLTGRVHMAQPPPRPCKCPWSCKYRMASMRAVAEVNVILPLSISQSQGLEMDVLHVRVVLRFKFHEQSNVAWTRRYRPALFLAVSVQYGLPWLGSPL